MKGEKYKEEKINVKPTRIGELGEYKINIQLDQLPRDCKYLSDVLIPSLKSKSDYTQIDHVVITPYAVFVIETKNYLEQFMEKNGVFQSINHS